MREIKFRAWIKEGRQLNEDVFSIHGDGSVSVISEYTIDGEHRERELVSYPANAIEIMQFTGIKDKNSKEIYEGDVVKWIITRGIIEGGTSKVVYCPETMCFALQDKGVMSVWGMDEVIELEIIGNIYENPELLNNK